MVNQLHLLARPWICASRLMLLIAGGLELIMLFLKMVQKRLVQMLLGSLLLLVSRGSYERITIIISISSIIALIQLLIYSLCLDFTHRLISRSVVHWEARHLINLRDPLRCK